MLDDLGEILGVLGELRVLDQAADGALAVSDPIGERGGRARREVRRARRPGARELTRFDRSKVGSSSRELLMRPEERVAAAGSFASMATAVVR